jgi:uncharacterized NAD-dependent epimerase/dehydratase family protein
MTNQPHPYSPFMIVAQGNAHKGIVWRIQIPGTGQLIGAWKKSTTAEKYAAMLATGVVTFSRIPS